jgi:hypothetical protein
MDGLVGLSGLNGFATNERMSGTKKRNDTAAALAVIRTAPARGHGRRSPVYEWLAERHDDLAEDLNKPHPAWTALAKYLAEGGVMDANGDPPTGATVRSTWLRVKEQTAKRKRHCADALPATQPKSEPSPSKPEAAGKEPPDDDDPPRPTFLPSRPKD